MYINNASNLNPDPMYAALNFNHPTLLERLRALSYVASEDADNNDHHQDNQKKEEDNELVNANKGKINQNESKQMNGYYEFTDE